MAKLIFEFAAMNSGKSTKLLQTHFNYVSQNINAIIIKPSIDNRSSKVTSRIGLEAPCINVSPNEKPSDFINTEVKAVLVDEAQFFSKEQILDLRKIVDERQIDVICFGLRTDFRGDLFEGSATLLARADKFRELTNICHCGSKATMVLKIQDGKVIKEGPQIDCGAEEKYISVCHKHWHEEKPYA